MQYVCRSCLLRLGQSWRIPTQQRPSRNLLPYTTSQANHIAISHNDGTAPGLHGDPARYETDPVLTNQKPSASEKMRVPREPRPSVNPQAYSFRKVLKPGVTESVLKKQRSSAWKNMRVPREPRPSVNPQTYSIRKFARPGTAEFLTKQRSNASGKMRFPREPHPSVNTQVYSFRKVLKSGITESVLAKERSSASEEMRISGRPHPSLDPQANSFRKVLLRLGTTESISTFTSQDKRVEFIKEIDTLETQPLQLFKVLRRFGEWELFQRERLESLSPKETRRNSISIFAAWKSIVKRFRPTAQQSRTPKGVRKTQVEWIRGCKTVEEMMESMSKIHDIPDRRERDRILLSLALEHAPDKADMLLECVFRDHMPRSTPYFYVVEDTLELLAMRLHGMESDEKGAYAVNLASLVISILKNTRNKIYFQINQATIYRIMNSLPPARLQAWFEELGAFGCTLHPFTELQFAARFAKLSSTKALSPEILQRLQEVGLLDINSPVGASICTSILTFKKEELTTMDGHIPTPADLFGLLRNIGLNPNVITYSAIIRGLCLRKDLKTALDVFEVMKHHGVQPDEFTYSILINGCKKCGDFPMLADLAVEACNANIRDPIVWNEVLHSVYTACLRERKTPRGPRRTALYPLNTMYSRLFDPSPIRPFITGRLTEMGEHMAPQVWFPEGLARITTDIPPLPPQDVLQPGSDTLAIMILGLVRYLPLPYDVVTFYSQYRELLKQGHPVAERLIRERGTFVHDIVLRNLMKWRGTLRVAIDIIQDMMKNTNKDMGSSGPPSGTVESNIADTNEKPDSTTLGEGVPSPVLKVPQASPMASQEEIAPAHIPIQHPAPSVYTWSILIHGFMKHKQPNQAKQCIDLMRQHGVEPNIVTWNTLAAGYAKMQEIPKAVEAMRLLETEGFKADDWTLRAFSYIKNKDKAIDLMEATVEANRAKQQQEYDFEQQLEQQEYHLDSPLLAKEDDEDDILDEELEARLSQLDPGTMSRDVSKKILEGLEETGTLISVSEEEENRRLIWARVRENGLDAMPTIKYTEASNLRQPTQKVR